MSIHRILFKDLMAIFGLVLCAPPGTTLAQTSPADEQRAFADRMMVCNAHALLLKMYAQGTVPSHIPAPAPYRDLALAADKDYAAQRMNRSHYRDLALAELEPLLNTRPMEGLSEAQKDEHVYAMWSQLIESCNAAAAQPPLKN